MPGVPQRSVCIVDHQWSLEWVRYGAIGNNNLLKKSLCWSWSRYKYVSWVSDNYTGARGPLETNPSSSSLGGLQFLPHRCLFLSLPVSLRLGIQAHEFQVICPMNSGFVAGKPELSETNKQTAPPSQNKPTLEKWRHSLRHWDGPLWKRWWKPSEQQESLWCPLA